MQQDEEEIERLVEKQMRQREPNFEKLSAMDEMLLYEWAYHVVTGKFPCM